MSLLTPIASSKTLAALCRRMATSLEAGLDLRRILSREAEGLGPRSQRVRMAQVRASIEAGHTLSDALEPTADYFPRLFLQLVAVGEETGQLAEVFRRLAEHYERQVTLRRNFLSAISWPMMQLTAALLIVGLVIYLMGWIADLRGGTPVDILGFGLTGSQGATLYFAFVGAVLATCWLTYEASRRRAPWVAPLERLGLRMPVLGAQLETLCLARLAWSMHLTLDTGMSLVKALPLCLDAARHPDYARCAGPIVDDIRNGAEIHEALAGTGLFPGDFLETLEVGERSGRLPESMGLLSNQYTERAQAALAILTRLAGFGVWALVACFIIFLIFRIAMSVYIGPIYDALEM